MFVLVLNQSNLVQDGQNNKLIYKFPNSVILTHKYIAVSSVTMYYSWFNITQALGNNIITYTFGDAQTVYTITIPDGLYEITDINNYCQFAMIANGTYYSDASYNYYPFDLYINPTRYAVQLNTYLMPTGAQATANGTPYPYPTDPTAPVPPTTPLNPIVTFPPNFSSVVGYSANFATNNNYNNLYVPPTPANASNNYVTKSTNGTLAYLSNVAPQVQPNSNLLINLSNINNPYSQPSGIIYSLTPSVAIGEIINDRPPNFMWNKMIDGTYNQITLSFLGANLQPLTIRDPQMTILLTIRDRDEAFLGSK
jgi:hypothetical protein